MLVLAALHGQQWLCRLCTKRLHSILRAGCACCQAALICDACVCSKARRAASRAQEEADALKAEAKRAREKAADLLANLRAAEDDVSFG